MQVRPSKVGRVAALAAGVLLLAGCSEKKEAPAAPAQAPAQPVAAASAEVAVPAGLEEAAKVFASRCAMCHGPKGAGDGPVSGGFNPPPRNFQDPAWQAEVSDDYLEKIIVEGGPAVGRSAAMPPSPDLAGKPVVKGLRQYIRALGPAK